MQHHQPSVRPSEHRGTDLPLRDLPVLSSIMSDIACSGAPVNLHSVIIGIVPFLSADNLSKLIEECSKLAVPEYKMIYGHDAFRRLVYGKEASTRYMALLVGTRVGDEPHVLLGKIVAGVELYNAALPIRLRYQTSLSKLFQRTFIEHSITEESLIEFLDLIQCGEVATIKSKLSGLGVESRRSILGEIEETFAIDSGVRLWRIDPQVHRLWVRSKGGTSVSPHSEIGKLYDTIAAMIIPNYQPPERESTAQDDAKRIQIARAVVAVMNGDNSGWGQLHYPGSAFMASGVKVGAKE